MSFEKKDYQGAKSTLCTGCGHDSVTNNIIAAYFQSGIAPYSIAKLSGIGCSSKTPTYFIDKAHGFNAIHGRMAPVATGAKIANWDLHIVGVSGDGDTASIGLGGFAHIIRRNLPMVYIIENNGVYGLTKGQFSATADVDSTLKTGEKNPFTTIDLCSMAIDLGCGFVGRAFSGDAKQLTPMIAAAIQHPGTAIIDVVSPCITFANHEGSTKSFNYVKEHKVALNELGVIQPKTATTADYKEGDSQAVELADGSHILLKKLEANFDLNRPDEAQRRLRQAREKGEVLTGLFYLDQQQQPLESQLSLPKAPLSQLSEAQARPSKQQFEDALNQYR